MRADGLRWREVSGGATAGKFGLHSTVETSGAKGYMTDVEDIFCSATQSKRRVRISLPQPGRFSLWRSCAPLAKLSRTLRDLAFWNLHRDSIRVRSMGDDGLFPRASLRTTPRHVVSRTWPPLKRQLSHFGRWRALGAAFGSCSTVGALIGPATNNMRVGGGAGSDGCAA